MSDYLKPYKNNLFKKIRSGVKLKQIFSCLEKKKTLKIIKYNNQIKRRLNLDYSDYKPFCTIEIELFPIENKYGKFVNILNNDEEKYYHFYFNDSENEIKRNTINENDNVTKIKIILDYDIISLSKLFYNLNVLNQYILKSFVGILFKI